MECVIKRATVSDVNSINNIENNLPKRILSFDDIINDISNPNTYYFIAQTNDLPIGYISVKNMIDHIDIISIAVEEKYRKKRIGTILLNRVFVLAKELNISSIYLEVRVSNKSAINFYEKNGFNLITTRKNYYSDNHEDAFIYLKNLV